VFVLSVRRQSEIMSLKADNERLQTVIAEKAGIDGAELLKQTSAHAASAADATSGRLLTISSSSASYSLLSLLRHLYTCNKTKIKLFYQCCFCSY